MAGRCWRTKNHLHFFRSIFILTHHFLHFVFSFSLFQWIGLENAVGGSWGANSVSSLPTVHSKVRWWGDPKIYFAFVNHEHIQVICVCVAQISVPKINFVYMNHKCIINLWLNFWWRERGVGSQHTNWPKTKQCSHLHPLIHWCPGPKQNVCRGRVGYA